jgi:hypothetical protein
LGRTRKASVRVLAVAEPLLKIAASRPKLELPDDGLHEHAVPQGAMAPDAARTTLKKMLYPVALVIAKGVTLQRMPLKMKTLRGSRTY